MLHESLFGRAEPKRSFNVHANLLAERHANTQRVVSACRKRLLAAAASLFVATAGLPSLYSWQQAAQARSSTALAATGKLSKELEALGTLRDASVPKIADSEMIGIMKTQTDRLLAQIVIVLNATPGQARLNGFKADVLGGEVTIACSAEAESYQVLRQFLDESGKGPGAISTVLSSTRGSEALSSEGVAFDFVKKAAVSN